MTGEIQFTEIDLSRIALSGIDLLRIVRFRKVVGRGLRVAREVGEEWP